MKFKKPIEVQAGISDGDPTNPLGLPGYLLSSDGSNVNWISPGGLSAETAEAIVQPIKANEALTKGDPLYIVGYQSGQNVNIVAKADSSDAAKMPVVGLADDDYANQNFGTMTAFGSFNGAFDTTGGTENWAIGDIIFVKAGGGLTNVKPTGTDLIQNIAIVSRVNSQTGELEVIALGRTNDVPNLPTGRLFVGTAANTSLASDVIYVDDTNDRVGIGTTSPSFKLDVTGDGIRNVRSTAGWAGWFENTNNSSGVIVTAGADSGDAPLLIRKQDGTELFSVRGNGTSWFNNGNVGIGTTSPSANLYVSGSNADATDKPTMISESVFTIKPVALNSGNLNFAQVDSGNSIGMQYTNGAGTANWDISMQPFGGNVGIGTTSPGSKLEISSTSDALLELNGGTTANPYMLFAQNGTRRAFIQYVNGGLLSLASEYGDIRFMTGTGGTETEKMRIDSAGNVGIGVTVPQKKLSVYGDTLIESSGLTASLWFRPSATYGAGGIQTMKVTGSGNPYHTTTSFSNYDAANVLNIVNDNVGIGTTSPTSPLTIKSNSTSSSSSGLTIQSNGNTNNIFELAEKSTDGARLQMYDAGVAKIALYTDGTNNYINAGNVGIGTTSPTNGKLVIDSTANQIAIETGTAGDGRLNIGHFSNGTFIGTYGDDGGAADLIRFGTHSGDERMRIDSTGNVGIGTTSPRGKLDIVGNTDNDADFLTIQDNDSSAGSHRPSVRFRSDTAQIGQIVGLDGSMRFSSGSTENSMIEILDSGNVGIGTTSPDAKLNVTDGGTQVTISTTYLAHLQSASNCGLAITAGASSNNYIAFGDSDNYDEGIINYNNSTRSFAFRTADGALDDLVIDSAGNVGIGTTSPQQPFQVDAGSNIASFRSVGTGANNKELLIQTGGDRVTLDAKNADDGTATSLAFELGNSEKARLTPTGLGIGTTSPENKLHVQQSALYTGIQSTAGIRIKSDGASAIGNYHGTIALSRGTGSVAISAVQEDTDSDVMGMAFFTHPSATGGDAAVEKMRIDQNGNVGIGTTGPSYKLDIESSDWAQARFSSTSSGYAPASILLESADSDSRGQGVYQYNSVSKNSWFSGVPYSTTSDDWVIAHKLETTAFNPDVAQMSNALLCVNDNGNVGIGTTTPSAKLDIRTDTGVLIKGATSASNGKLKFIPASGGRQYNFENDGASFKIVDASAGSTRMYFHYNENLGIGTTSPGYKLSVSGGIEAGGVVTYSKVAGSLDTTGYAIAGLGTAYNGASAGFTFTAYGGAGHYQKVVYSCFGSGTNWVVDKVIDEGTNVLDIAASAASAATIVFTFKTRSGSQGYSPRVVIEATGHSIISTYA